MDARIAVKLLLTLRHALECLEKSMQDPALLNELRRDLLEVCYFLESMDRPALKLSGGDNKGSKI
jgi:hypothetical protein